MLFISICLNGKHVSYSKFAPALYPIITEFSNIIHLTKGSCFRSSLKYWHASRKKKCYNVGGGQFTDEAVQGNTWSPRSVVALQAAHLDGCAGGSVRMLLRGRGFLGHGVVLKDSEGEAARGKRRQEACLQGQRGMGRKGQLGKQRKWRGWKMQ